LSTKKGVLITEHLFFDLKTVSMLKFKKNQKNFNTYRYYNDD